MKKLLIKVSIPYRRTKNYNAFLISFTESRFQSLIGELKTEWKVKEGWTLNLGFQSLIGELKTSILIRHFRML